MAQPKKKASLQLAEGPERLYQKPARQLFSELAAGRSAVGDRLRRVPRCAGIGHR